MVKDPHRPHGTARLTQEAVSNPGVLNWRRGFPVKLPLVCPRSLPTWVIALCANQPSSLDGAKFDAEASAPAQQPAQQGSLPSTVALVRRAALTTSGVT